MDGIAGKEKCLCLAAAAGLPGQGLPAAEPAMVFGEVPELGSAEPSGTPLPSGWPRPSYGGLTSQLVINRAPGKILFHTPHMLVRRVKLFAIKWNTSYYLY